MPAHNKRYWLIEITRRFEPVFRKRLAGNLSNQKITTILQRLASRDLTPSEVIAASIRNPDQISRLAYGLMALRTATGRSFGFPRLMKNTKRATGARMSWQRQIIPRYCQRINARAAGSIAAVGAGSRASVPEIRPVRPSIWPADYPLKQACSPRRMTSNCPLARDRLAPDTLDFSVPASRACP